MSKKGRLHCKRSESYRLNIHEKPLVRQLAEGKLSPKVYLELADAIYSTQVPDLISKYKQASLARSADEFKGVYAAMRKIRLQKDQMRHQVCPT
jgi:hypothetical protein